MTRPALVAELEGSPYAFDIRVQLTRAGKGVYRRSSLLRHALHHQRRAEPAARTRCCP